MKKFDKIASMVELENVSGGNYKEYIQVSNAITKRISELNNASFDSKTERLSQKETANWLKTNLNIGVDFGIRIGFKLCEGLNKPASYYSIAATTPGKSFSHADVLNMISNWKA